MTQIVICGAARSGKTTFASILVTPNLLHTDDLQGLPWSESSAAVVRWMEDHSSQDYVVEGVRGVHALRKWLDAHREGKPCDRVYWFNRPVVAVTPKQTSFFRACGTIWDQVKGPLIRRGVEILPQPR